MPSVREGRSAPRSRMHARRGPLRFTRAATSRDQASGGPLDPERDRIGGIGRVEDHEAARLGDREREEAVPDPTMEIDVEGRLESRTVVRRFASQTDLDREIEEDREVRAKAVGRDRLE